MKIWYGMITLTKNTFFKKKENSKKGPHLGPEIQFLQVVE